MADVILGFDPGGDHAFGWCVLEDAPILPLKVLRSGVESHAFAALKAATKTTATEDVKACGIDAPLHYVDNGDREVDKHVRDRIPLRSVAAGTVQAVNSLQGACLAQGVMVGRLVQTKCLDIHVTEAHPKAVLWLLGIATAARRPSSIALQHLTQWLTPLNVTVGHSEHERDAALSALTAWAMHHNAQGWKNIGSLDSGSHRHDLLTAPQYWIPA